MEPPRYAIKKRSTQSQGRQGREKTSSLDPTGVWLHTAGGDFASKADPQGKTGGGRDRREVRTGWHGEPELAEGFTPTTTQDDGWPRQKGRIGLNYRRN